MEILYKIINQNMKQKGNISIPMAIIVAGLIIAGALIFVKSDNNLNPPSDRGASQKATTAAINARAVSADDHILGSPDANVIIIEYSDTECPFCKRFHTTMHQIIDKYGKDGSVAWVYRHFPLVQLHPKAPKESEALECAGDLGGNSKFWDYADKLYEITPSNNGLDLALLPQIAEDVGLNRDAFVTCLDSGKHAQKVKDDLEDATEAGGRGTPYSVITLKKKIGNNTELLINSLSAQIPPGTIVVSDDKKRIGMSGALPFEMIEQILQTMI
jgi:protein-disulfide isomerase